MKNIFRPLIIILALFVLSCEDDNKTNQAPKIESANDAQDLAYEIGSALGTSLLSYRTNSKDWNNEVKQGAYNGSVTLNGSYEYEYVSFLSSANKRYYRFKDVNMNFVDFCSDSDSDALTFSGTGKVNGKVIEKDASPANKYYGGWSLSVNLKLSGQFSDNITMNIYYGNDSFMKNFEGSLTNSVGETYSFSSRY